MKEEIKELIINNTRHEFFFDGQSNTWRSTANKYLVPDHSIDLVIDLPDQGNIDWKVVTDLIKFLNFKGDITSNNVENARSVLWSFFKMKYKKVYENDFFQGIFFNPLAIHFKGAQNGGLIYDCHFYPQHLKDNTTDLGQALYKANFRDKYLLGVSCDTP